jgi:FHA domain
MGGGSFGSTAKEDVMHAGSPYLALGSGSGVRALVVLCALAALAISARNTAPMLHLRQLVRVHAGMDGSDLVARRIARLAVRASPRRYSGKRELLPRWIVTASPEDAEAIGQDIVGITGDVDSILRTATKSGSCVYAGGFTIVRIVADAEAKPGCYQVTPVRDAPPPKGYPGGDGSTAGAPEPLATGSSDGMDPANLETERATWRAGPAVGLRLTPIDDPELTEILVPPGGAVLGRERGNGNIVIPRNRVSRTHCSLEVDGDEMTVIDKGSSNGTWVQRRTVTLPADKAPVRLRSGDILHLGSSVRYRVSMSDLAQRTTADPGTTTQSWSRAR